MASLHDGRFARRDDVTVMVLRGEVWRRCDEAAERRGRGRGRLLYLYVLNVFCGAWSANSKGRQRDDPNAPPKRFLRMLDCDATLNSVSLAQPQSRQIPPKPPLSQASGRVAGQWLPKAPANVHLMVDRPSVSAGAATNRSRNSPLGLVDNGTEVSVNASLAGYTSSSYGLAAQTASQARQAACLPAFALLSSTDLEALGQLGGVP